MKRIRLLDGAEDDLQEAATFLEQRRSGLGDRFVSAIEHSFQRLAANPNLGSAVNTTYRRLRVRGFSYNLIYRIETEDVLVVAVAHHRRRPGYWRKRP